VLILLIVAYHMLFNWVQWVCLLRSSK